MASSTYKVSVLAYRLDRNAIDSTWIRPQDSLMRVLGESSDKLDVAYTGDRLKTYDEIHPETSGPNPPKIIRIFGDKHICRETLLSEINCSLDTFSFLDKFDWHHKKIQGAKYANYVVFIRYMAEGDDYLSKGHRELCMEFYRKFLGRESGSNFFVQESGSEIILSYKDIGDITKQYMASFILWIFRHHSIMKHMLEKYKDSTTILMSRWLEYISLQFLRNPYWGDYANPAIMLSLFAWGQSHVSTGTKLRVEMHNGPATFAQDAYTPYIMRNWMEKVVLVAYPNKINTDNSGLRYCNDDTKNSVNALYDLFQQIAHLKTMNLQMAETVRSVEFKLDSVLEKVEDTKSAFAKAMSEGV